MMRNAWVFTLAWMAAVPAWACGGNSAAQVAMFLGVLFVVPVMSFFMAQLTLLRMAQDAFATRASPAWRLTLAAMTLATVTLGMSAGASLGEAGLAVLGVPLFLLQFPTVVLLARAAFERPLRAAL